MPGLTIVAPAVRQGYGNEVSNHVYHACVGIYERLETQGLIFGNGHHMAQRVAAYAERTLLSRFHTAEGEPPPLIGVGDLIQRLEAGIIAHVAEGQPLGPSLTETLRQILALLQQLQAQETA